MELGRNKTASKTTSFLAKRKLADHSDQLTFFFVHFFSPLASKKELITHLLQPKVQGWGKLLNAKVSTRRKIKR